MTERTPPLREAERSGDTANSKSYPAQPSAEQGGERTASAQGGVEATPRAPRLHDLAVDDAPSGRTGWRSFIDLIKDLGEVAKFAVLVLALAGLIGLYFPVARTWLETKVNPSAWYYVGKVDGGKFTSEPFQHPAWSGGTAPQAALLRVPGTTMVTLGGGLHIGRRAAGSGQPILTNLGGGVCLHVGRIERTGDAQHPSAFVWVEAVRITC